MAARHTLLLLKRFTLVVLAATALVALPANARDMTGIYVATYSGTVVYFNLTDLGDRVTGYMQVVGADNSQSDGVKRESMSVSGIVNGSRLVLDLSGHGQSYEWTADLSWAGFTVNIPMSSGQINQATFRRSSVSEVNQLVANITRAGNSTKYYSNARAELNDSESHLVSLFDKSRSHAAITSGSTGTSLSALGL